MTLVIDEPHAQWSVAYHIANIINSEFDVGDEGSGVRGATARGPARIFLPSNYPTLVEPTRTSR